MTHFLWSSFASLPTCSHLILTEFTNAKKDLFSHHELWHTCLPLKYFSFLKIMYEVLAKSIKILFIGNNQEKRKKTTPLLQGLVVFSNTFQEDIETNHLFFKKKTLGCIIPSSCSQKEDGNIFRKDPDLWDSVYCCESVTSRLFQMRWL